MQIPMQLRHLRYFVGIVDAGSFSRAAAKIHVAQPALSQQIAELELKLGLPLLERTPRGVTPTAAGRALYQEATSILRQMAQLPGKVRSSGGEPEGHVQLAMSGALSPSLTGPFLAACKAVLPKVSLRLGIGDSESLKAQVLAQTLELALIFEDEFVTTLSRQPLMQQQLFVISAVPLKGSPGISLERLAAMPLIVPSFPNVVRPILQRACGPANVSLNIVAEVNGIQGILSAVKAGVGSVVLPTGDIEGMAGSSDWPEPLPIQPALFATISVVWSKDSPLTPAAEAVRKQLIAFVEDYLRRTRPRGVSPCRPWDIAPSARRVGL